MHHHGYNKKKQSKNIRPSEINHFYHRNDAKLLSACIYDGFNKIWEITLITCYFYNLLISVKINDEDKGDNE